MSRNTPPSLSYQPLELDGVRYAVIREPQFRELCRRARVKPACAPTASRPEHSLAEIDAFDSDHESLAQRIIHRRRQARLSQAELARRAGVRVETLNRIERAKTTPDFATIRKLVIAMNQAEATLKSVKSNGRQSKRLAAASAAPSARRPTR